MTGDEDGVTDGEGVEDCVTTGEVPEGVTDGEGVEDCETTGDEDGVTDGEGVETKGDVVPDSIGEDAEGVTE